MYRARSAAIPRTLAIRLALAVAGSALLAVSAHVAVPLVPVPVTVIANGVTFTVSVPPTSV